MSLGMYQYHISLIGTEVVLSVNTRQINIWL
jgi:hypothetical protein